MGVVQSDHGPKNGSSCAFLVYRNFVERNLPEPNLLGLSLVSIFNSRFDLYLCSILPVSIRTPTAREPAPKNRQMRRSRRKDAAGGTKVAESTCSIEPERNQRSPLFCNALHGRISSALKVGGSL